VTNARLKVQATAIGMIELSIEPRKGDMLA
jgi:hypothetical protein